MAVPQSMILTFANRMIGKTATATVSTKNYNCERILFDGAELNLVNVNVSKIRELLAIQPAVGCAYKIMHNNEQCFWYLDSIYDANGTALFTLARTDRDNSIKMKVSINVLANEKSWFCFVIRRYIVPYVMKTYNTSSAEVKLSMECELQIVTVPKKVLIETVKELNGLE